MDPISKKPNHTERQKSFPIIAIPQSIFNPPVSSNEREAALSAVSQKLGKEIKEDDWAEQIEADNLAKDNRLREMGKPAVFSVQPEVILAPQVEI